jgi:hypothetical protein
MGLFLIDNKKALMNVLRNALRPGYTSEMLRKLFIRWRERGTANARSAMISWCRQYEESFYDWARELDDELLKEANCFSNEQKERVYKIFGETGNTMAGGGLIP